MNPLKLILKLTLVLLATLQLSQAQVTNITVVPLSFPTNIPIMKDFNPATDVWALENPSRLPNENDWDIVFVKYTGSPETGYTRTGDEVQIQNNSGIFGYDPPYVGVEFTRFDPTNGWRRIYYEGSDLSSLMGNTGYEWDIDQWPGDTWPESLEYPFTDDTFLQHLGYLPLGPGDTGSGPIPGLTFNNYTPGVPVSSGNTLTLGALAQQVTKGLTFQDGQWIPTE